MDNIEPTNDCRDWGPEGRKLALKLLEVVRSKPITCPECIPFFEETIEEAAAPIERHVFHHRINIDKVSLKLDKRVEALEKRLAPSKYKY